MRLASPADISGGTDNNWVSGQVTANGDLRTVEVPSLIEVTKTPTVTANSAYSGGNSVGGMMTLLNVFRVAGGQVMLQDVMVLDKDHQAAAIKILFYNALPTGTYADKASPALATDILKVIGEVTVAAASYDSLGSDSMGIFQSANLNLLLDSNEATTSLYALALVSTTPTWTTTSAVTFRFRFKQG